MENGQKIPRFFLILPLISLVEKFHKIGFPLRDLDGCSRWFQRKLTVQSRRPWFSDGSIGATEGSRWCCFYRQIDLGEWDQSVETKLAKLISFINILDNVTRIEAFINVWWRQTQKQTNKQTQTLLDSDLVTNCPS